MTDRKKSLYRQQKEATIGQTARHEGEQRATLVGKTPIAAPAIQPTAVKDPVFEGVSAEDMATELQNVFSPAFLAQYRTSSCDNDTARSEEHASTEVAPVDDSPSVPELRFNWRGEVVVDETSKQCIDDDHIHQSDLRRLYTLPQLVRMAHSAVQAQCVEALVVLGNITRLARTGRYENVPDPNLWLRLRDCDTVRLARLLMDRKSLIVFAHAISFLHAMLIDDDEERYVDNVLLSDLYLPGSKPAESPTDEVDDAEALRRDIVAAMLARLNLAARVINYLHAVGDNGDPIVIVKCLQLLGRLARHSADESERLASPAFLDVCTSSPLLPDVVRGNEPKASVLIPTIRLLRTLAHSSRTVADSIVARNVCQRLRYYIGGVREIYVDRAELRDAHLEALRFFVVIAAYDVSVLPTDYDDVVNESLLSCRRVQLNRAVLSNWDYQRLALNMAIVYQLVQFGNGLKLNRAMVDRWRGLIADCVVRWLHELSRSETFSAGSSKLVATGLSVLCEELQNLFALGLDSATIEQYGQIVHALDHLFNSKHFRDFLCALRTINIGNPWSLDASLPVLPLYERDGSAATGERPMPRNAELFEFAIKHAWFAAGVPALAEFLFNGNCVEQTADLLRAANSFYDKNSSRSDWLHRPLTSTMAFASLFARRQCSLGALNGQAVALALSSAIRVTALLLPEDDALASRLFCDVIFDDNISMEVMQASDDNTPGRFATTCQEMRRFYIDLVVERSGIFNMPDGSPLGFLTCRLAGDRLLGSQWELRYSSAQLAASDSARSEASAKCAVDALDYLLACNSFIQRAGGKCRWSLTSSRQEVFLHLGKLFETYGPNLYWDAEVSAQIRCVIAAIVGFRDSRGYIRPTSLLASTAEMDSHAVGAFSELLEDFTEASYGSDLYALYLIAAAVKCNPIALRLVFWRHRAALRLMRLGVNALPWSVNDYIEAPDVVSCQLVWLQALVVLDAVIDRRRNELLYRIAVTQVKSFLSGPAGPSAGGSENNARQQLRDKLRLAIEAAVDSVANFDMLVVASQCATATTTLHRAQLK